MKTQNDQRETIYVCRCCQRTWRDKLTYQMHLEAMIRNIKEDLLKDLGVAK